MKRTLLFGLALSASISVSGQVAPEEISGYLAKNQFDFEKAGQYKPLLKDLRESTFIALGEVHGSRLSYHIHDELIRLIAAKAGLKYYLCELDYSSSFFLNRFLRTGNEEFLDKVFSKFSGTFFYSKEIAQTYRNLREHESLRDLELIGVDLTHIPLIAIEHLQFLLAENSSLAEKEEFKRLNEFINQPAGQVTYRNNDFLNLLLLASEGLEVNKEFCEKELGDLFGDVRFILNSMGKTYEIKTSDEAVIDSLRDRQMFENLQSIKQRRKIGDAEKMFFFGGREHILKAPLPDAEKFVHLVDKHISKGKTLSINMSYIDCRFMIPNEQFGIEGEGLYSEKDFFNDNGPFFKLEDIDLLTNQRKGKEIAGFRLYGKKSPFGKQQLFLDGYSTSLPTNRFYDYIILVSNSHAAEPYKEAGD